MAMFRCGGKEKVKLLYAGSVSLSGYTGSSASTHIDGSVFVGEGLTGVKCAATLTSDTSMYLGYKNEVVMFNISGSCSYNSSTGYVNVRYNGPQGFYGGGSGTAYVVVIQEL